MHLSRLIAKNFRCLRDVDVELRPFTVLVGPNGVGKSSLFQLLMLFRGASTPGGFSENVARLGGFAAILSLFDQVSGMDLGFDLSTDSSWYYSYRCALASSPGGFLVSNEELGQRTRDFPSNYVLRRAGDTVVGLDRGSLKRSRAAEFPSDLAVASVRFIPPASPNPAPVWNFLDQALMCSAHLFQPAGQVRAPQRIQPTRFPANDGSDLLSAIYNLKSSNKEKYEDFRHVLRLAVPEFEEIEFPIAGTGYLQLAWKQKHLARPLDASQLSDGTLRFLWLLTALQYVPDDSVVMIDEPELSLHPQWSQLMVSLLRDVSARCQVIVATQSTEFVRWAEPAEILVADLAEDGGANFKWADAHPNLDKWLKDFSLQEIWSMGELGGRR